MEKTNKETAGSNLIELRAVSKWFPSPGERVLVLRNINLTITQGEFLAIVGKSGSGKSTLLNMITGIDHPSEGSVKINNTEIHSLDETKLAKWRGENVGIVFQFLQLVPTLTIRENLLLAMNFVNSVSKEARSMRADTLLERVGILKHADKFPAALSGGEQQRAAIARALANDPPLLVADEPTGNLDSKNAEAIHILFRDLVRDRKTVIVVTHEDVTNSNYERIVSLADGEIVRDLKRLSSLEVLR